MMACLPTPDKIEHGTYNSLLCMLMVPMRWGTGKENVYHAVESRRRIEHQLATAREDRKALQLLRRLPIIDAATAGARLMSSSSDLRLSCVTACIIITIITVRPRTSLGSFS
jgi:hypothetical protein